MNRFPIFLLAVSGALTCAAQTVQKSTDGSSQRIFVEKPNSAIQEFGKVAFEVVGNGGQNAIVGGVRQTGTAGHSFPTGVTGYGSMEDVGNQAFGLFGRCDLGAPGMRISGTCTNELNSFNYGGSPSTLLPPDLSFAAVQRNAISLQLVAYGDYDSSIALNLAGGGGAKQFYVGEYVHPRNSIFAGLLVDANLESSARYGAILKSTSKNSPLRLESVGIPEPLNPVIEYIDGTGVTGFKLDQAGDATFAGTLAAKSISSLGAPLAISQGGTSTTTSNSARLALGAAQSGENADITTLTSIKAIALVPGGYLKLADSIVSSLPSCNIRFKGVMMAVTDALSPTYNGIVKGGGNSNVPVFCNGSEWTAH